ncbi:serine hydrolase [Facklamia miroungae]|uniref:Beta-lactamase enzyme family protein n=1 Tax=Facklamia miroungae TaxID=120956 RepID=A0A1G7TNZ2_9LACT|nr:serine hydrolase [Facklamia miroungae]NKZ29776.1 serine hydrolase [Facklamia miroungae]SDG36409.1 Beta-lactamase enzyme family protein [Facklamia miroungae]
MSFKRLFILIIFVFLTGCQNNSLTQTELNSHETTIHTSTQEVNSTKKTSDDSPSPEKDSSKKQEKIAFSRDYSQYGSIDELINELIDKYNYPASRLGIAYQNYIIDESYYLNENIALNAASTNKVGTAVLYLDLIEEGKINWDSQLPASTYDFETGGGQITNNPIQSSYRLEDLIANLLVYSDNTAWNILINYYQNNFGHFNHALIENSGATQIPDTLYSNLNFATPNTLLGYLTKIADNKKYLPIVEYLSESEHGQRFKLYINDGMATKYGQFDYAYHDTGIFYENGQAIYALVLMTDGVGTVDPFMGELNLIINEWYHYRLSLQ